MTADLSAAVEAVNRIAPEHLELCVADPFALLPQIRNAGSVFLGRSAPEALGDYFAGPNHTLPTAGTARFSSPLGVDDFRKRSSFLYYTREALAEAARIAEFAGGWRASTPGRPEPPPDQRRRNRLMSRWISPRSASRPIPPGNSPGTRST